MPAPALRLETHVFDGGGGVEVVAPSEPAVAVLRAISRAGFAYTPAKALCETAGWRLVDDEPDLGYIRYAMRLAANSSGGHSRC